MTEALTVTIEPVDDIPVLMTAATRLGLTELVDQHFKPHGNWQGLSPGRVLTGWLAYILSEGDHRLNQVQDWVAGRRTCCSLFWVRRCGRATSQMIGWRSGWTC